MNQISRIHHYVPRFYLRNFHCNNNVDFVYQFDVKLAERKLVPLNGAAASKNLYTVSKDTHHIVDCMERFYADIDGSFSSALHLIELHSPHLPATVKKSICEFVCAALFRSPLGVDAARVSMQRAATMIQKARASLHENMDYTKASQQVPWLQIWRDYITLPAGFTKWRAAIPLFNNLRHVTNGLRNPNDTHAVVVSIAIPFMAWKIRNAAIDVMEFDDNLSDLIISDQLLWTAS